MKKVKTKISDTAEIFYCLIKIIDRDLYNELSTEVRFHGKRKWRFDLALQQHFIGIEVDGGRWKAGGGRHSSCSDYEKLNEANCLGWRVLRFTAEQVKSNPIECVNIIKKLKENMEKII